MMYSIHINGKFYKETESKSVVLSDLDDGENTIEVIHKESGVVERTTINIRNVAAIEQLKDCTMEDLVPFKGKSGWYTFPDGHKVRGEDAALEYLKNLQ